MPPYRLQALLDIRTKAEEEAKDKGMKYAESYKVMILKRDEEEKVG